MISISFEERTGIGLHYILENLHGCSPFGQERIRHLKYYTPAERAALEAELDNTARAAAAASVHRELLDRIMIELCRVKDIRASLLRCKAGECLDHVELFELKGYAQRIETLLPLLSEWIDAAKLSGISLHDPAPVLGVLDPERTRSRGFYIPDGASEALRAVRKAKKQIEEQLWHAKTDAERDELRLQRTRICADEEREEHAVRAAMCAKLAPYADGLLADAETIGSVDFLIQKALFALRYACVRPTLTETELDLVDMINPEIQDLLAEKGRRFVPVSIALERGAAVITGANMGGKSVALKTVALIVLLCHAGFCVPAKAAKIPMFHCVKMLFEDRQSIQSGLSGFGSEIVQFEKALREVEQGYSLFLLDEFARGTNPDEGAVIVQAVTKYLDGVNAISVLSTHYDRVADAASRHYQIIGLRDADPASIASEIGVNPEDGMAAIARHMNYGLYRVQGHADCPKDALNICRMLSLKPEILTQIESLHASTDAHA